MFLNDIWDITGVDRHRVYAGGLCEQPGLPLYKQLWTFESYEKNFIRGLRADFTRDCNQSLSLTFPSLSGARS